MTYAIIAAGGIIAFVCAYILFKIKDSDNPAVSSLQPLFFFMVMASFIIIGSASYQSTEQCVYLVNESVTVGSTSTYTYDYQCQTVAENAGSWSYRLPLWFGYLGSGYVIIYFLYLMINLYKKTRGGERE